LARLVEASEIDPLDEERAKAVGVRLGRRDASDVADAHVVCCASEQRAAVVTSDSEDIRALAEPGESLTLVSI
jgi:predicted nucleic acid-binding protein